MTVRELMEALKKFPPDLKVYLHDSEFTSLVEVETIRQTKVSDEDADTTQGVLID